MRRADRNREKLATRFRLATRSGPNNAATLHKLCNRQGPRRWCARYDRVVNDSLPTRPTAEAQSGGDAPAPLLVAVMGEKVVTHMLPHRTACVIGRGAQADFQIDCAGLSREHARFERRESVVTLQDLGSSNGTFVNGERLPPHGEPRAVGAHDFLELGGLVVFLRDTTRHGEVSQYARAGQLARQVIATGESLLLVGEAGVGKTTLARQLAEGLEARLVEFDASALTHARLQRLARIDDGVVLLRGLDTLRPLEQTALRAALPRRGVRFISTTQHPLRGEDGAAFDERLLEAVAANPVHVPPLRGDPTRIDELCDAFFGTRGDDARPLSPSVRAVLWACDWPGNVPELHTVLAHARERAGEGTIDESHLDLGPEHRERMERRQIEQALEECAGNQTRTARKLGISRRTLVSRLDKYAIARPRKGRTASS